MDRTFLLVGALVLLMLVSIALVRSVDTATLVMGNLGFKQDTTNLSSNPTSGAEAAVSYITTNYNSLINNNSNQGYYASSLDDLDPTGSAKDASLAAVVALVRPDGRDAGFRQQAEFPGPARGCRLLR